MNSEFASALLEMIAGFAFAGAGFAIMFLTACAVVTAVFWIDRAFKRASYRMKLNRRTAELQKKEKRMDQVLRISKDEK